MVGFLVNRPYNIVAKQVAYQQSTLPIYLRQPRSRLYVGTYVAAWTVGVAGSLYGLARLIIGKRKPE